MGAAAATGLFRSACAKLLLLAALLAHLPACDRLADPPVGTPEASGAEARQNALAYLDDTVARLEKQESEASSAERKYLRARRDAIDGARSWLQSLPADAAVPIRPILAGLNKTPQGEYAVSLMWLGSASDAHGIHLSDAAGVVGEFDRCFLPLSKEELAVRATTLVQHTTVLFEQGGAKGEVVRPGVVGLGRELRLPPLKVRIRSNAATESSEIEATINWATVDPARRETERVPGPHVPAANE